MVTDQRADPEMQPPALLLDNVVKTYGPIRAVDGVSLCAHAGEDEACDDPNDECMGEACRGWYAIREEGS